MADTREVHVEVGADVPSVRKEASYFLPLLSVWVATQMCSSSSMLATAQ